MRVFYVGLINIYIQIHTHTHTHIYIYIYTAWRKRWRIEHSIINNRRTKDASGDFCVILYVCVCVRACAFLHIFMFMFRFIY